MTSRLSRRFTNHEKLGNPKRGGAAAREGRPFYPATVVSAADAPRVLIEGKNQRKIGDMVLKGAWRGMRIFTLTLPERTTCPPACHQWDTCYGNKMHWSRRHAPGPDLIAALWREVAALAKRHPEGFVVRLHILGDFYSSEYVWSWHAMMRGYPQLHVYGYTAHDAYSPEPVARALVRMLAEFPERWRVRFSVKAKSDAGTDATFIVSSHLRAIDCPAQTGKTAACGTCALCWGSERTIHFQPH